MNSKSSRNTLFRGFLSALVALSISLTAPQQARAQGYTNGDVNSFIAWACGDPPTTNLAQIMQDILDQLSSIRIDLDMTEGGGGMIGDPTQCLPGWDPNLNLPHLPNLAGCFDFSGLSNIGANIGSCLSGVIDQYGDLGQYFDPNWNYGNVVSCLEGLMQVPTLPVPEFLSNLGQVLDNIIAILNSASVDWGFYNGSYNFWVDFCNNHYNPSGYMAGGGGGGGTGMSTSASTGGSGTVIVQTGVTGGQASAINLNEYNAIAKATRNGKGKAKAMYVKNGKLYAKLTGLQRGKNKVEVTLKKGEVLVGVSNSTVTVN